MAQERDPIDDYAAVLSAQAKAMFKAGEDFRKAITEYVNLAEVEETEEERVRWGHVRGEIAARTVAGVLHDLFQPIATSLTGEPANWIGAAYEALEEAMDEELPQQYGLRALVAKHVMEWDAEDGDGHE